MASLQSLPVLTWPSSLHVYLCVSSPLLIRTPVILDQGPTLYQYDLILTNYICSNPISKWSHILRYPGLVLQHVLRLYKATYNSYYMAGARTRPPSLVLTISLWRPGALHPPVWEHTESSVQFVSFNTIMPSATYWTVWRGSSRLGTNHLKNQVSQVTAMLIQK